MDTRLCKLPRKPLKRELVFPPISLALPALSQRRVPPSLPQQCHLVRPVIDIADPDPAQEIVVDDLTDIPKDLGTVKPILLRRKTRKMMMYHSATFILKLRQRGKQLLTVVRSDKRTELSVWRGWHRLKRVFVRPRGTQVGDGMVKVDLQRIYYQQSYRLCS